MKTSRFLLSVLVFLFPLAAQADGVLPEPPITPLEILLEEAQEAIQREYYQFALERLDHAARIYPDSYEVPLLKGDLYNQKKLYNLAWENFSEANSLKTGDHDILYRMTTALGRLNRNRESVKLLETLKEEFPESLDVAADLGWMYFKTLRFREGEALLLEALETFGDSPGLLMTLGTMYSALYDYENSVDYYQRSIDAALEEGWDNFAAVGYYNLSLLNREHHHFQEALDNTRHSLKKAARASGYISLGELFVARMEFPRALEAFTKAYQEDDTPLSLVSLAELYWRFGMIDAAEAHLDRVREWQDDSWMYFFGIDPVRYHRDIHFLQGRIYRSRATALFRIPARGWQQIRNWARGSLYRLKSWYHRRLFRALSWKIGENFEGEGNSFDADISLYNALEEYPPLAEERLQRAEKFEIAVTPESEPTYFFEAGRLRKDSELLFRALEELDPVWEVQNREEALAALIPLWEKEGGSAQKARDRLYEINPGAFPREGLVFSVVWEGPDDGGLKNELRRGGIDLRSPDDTGEAKYRLAVEVGKTVSRVLLKEDRTGALLWVETLDGKEFTEGNLTDLVLAEAILRVLFMVRG